MTGGWSCSFELSNDDRLLTFFYIIRVVDKIILPKSKISHPNLGEEGAKCRALMYAGRIRDLPWRA